MAIDAPRPAVLVDPWGRRMREVFSPVDMDRLHALADVVWGIDEPMPVDEARRAIGEAVAVVTAGWRYGPLPLEPSPLRAIIDVGGGFPPEIDYPACFRRGIRVLTAAPGFARPVAEMAIGLALASTREIASGDRAMRAGDESWQHAGNTSTVMLYGKPVGLVGFGSIARALVPHLAPFGCRVRVYDPWLGDGFLRHYGVEPMGLDDVLRSSYVLFVLAVPTSENTALLSRERLMSMPEGAIVVLMSRAHVVDFDALTDLVLAGRLKAAIDVFPSEPLPLEHPIRRAPGAVLSAHRAGSVPEGLWDLGELVVDDLEALVRDLPPQRLQQATPELIARLSSSGAG